MSLNGIGPSGAGLAPGVGSAPVTASTNTARDVSASPDVAAASAGANAVPVAGHEVFSPEHINSVVKRANSLLEDLSSAMRLEYKLENNQPQVDLVDRKTGTAIRTFPATAFVQMVHREFVGLLMDNYA